jgi:hypothetical protein
MSEIKKIGQIIEGHFNKQLNKVGLLPSDTKALSELRFADCLLCDALPHPSNKNINGPGLRDKKYCNACGCDMEAKTKVINATCPIGKW